VLTFEWRRSPFAASEPFESAEIAVATPRLSAYQPCHSIPAALSVGITTRLATMLRLSGFPDGPRRIGPDIGFLSSARNAESVVLRGSITGTGFPLPSVLGELTCVCHIDCRTRNRRVVRPSSVNFGQQTPSIYGAEVTNDNSAEARCEITLPQCLVAVRR
jgi:hypothetical protein